MYLHLGQDTIVLQSEVVGIFDLDNCSGSHITRDFLAKAERAGQVAVVAEELPKSFVIVTTAGKTAMYLSQLSTATLQKRSAAVGFEH
ncbi:MAG: DUF370 domain-containing protein [Oscillospiraceae bacterium]|nr:DUF370 domain-containing protein [Oscillospiraceae bacterium]